MFLSEWESGNEDSLASGGLVSVAACQPAVSHRTCSHSVLSLLRIFYSSGLLLVLTNDRANLDWEPSEPFRVGVECTLCACPVLAISFPSRQNRNERTEC